jgi:hypothetical protein
LKIIIPCCDRTCYKEDIPRFITIGINNIISSFNSKDIVVAIYKDHYNKYKDDIKNAELCSFDKTFSCQAETISDTIKSLNINDSIFIKDCDSKFDFLVKEADNGYVCVSSLNNFTSINVNNKSYIQIDHNNNITNIRENIVISNLFSVGGYYFPDAKEFVSCYEQMTRHLPDWQKQIFISDVIGFMILNDVEFGIELVENYQDFGTSDYLA